MDKSAEAAPVSVYTDELNALAASGRLATALFRLGRVALTGLVYVERDEGAAVLSMRDGQPVFIEDLSGGPTLADAFLEQGLVTPAQHASIMQRVADDLTGSEDLAFAEKAIAAGLITRSQVDAELERRVRGLLIRALAWERVRIEIEEDPEALTGPEYPQELAPLLYMSVRTFFEEDRVRELLGADDDVLVRLTRPRSEVVGRFGLDGAEVELLDALAPNEAVSRVVERLRADPFEAYQLVLMLVLSEHAEHGKRPWSAPVHAPAAGAPSTASPAGPAAREPRAPAGGRYVTSEIREERVGPIERPRPQRAPTVQYQGSPPRQTAPVARPAQAEPSAPTGAVTRSASAPTSAATVSTRPAAAPSSATPVAKPAQHAANTSASTAAPAAAAPVAPRPPDARRRVGAALKRLGRELEERRTQQVSAPPRITNVRDPSGSVTQGPSADAAAAAAAKEAEHSAVRELIRRRRAQVSQQAREGGAAPVQRSGADLFRAGQEALRDQQFLRAFETLSKAIEAEPKNEAYQMYRLWAGFRASALKEDEKTQFRNMLREKLNDDLHKPFAFYAMGHFVMADKGELAAEKFFKKAVELDKTNKDAERFLRIIELRKKQQVEQAPQKIFGIEIGGKKGDAGKKPEAGKKG